MVMKTRLGVTHVVCSKEILMLISAYADGEVTPEESMRAAAHLQDCAECRKLVDEWRGQLSVFKWAYTRNIPEEYSVEELKQIVQQKMPVVEVSRRSKMSVLRQRMLNLPIISWRPVWSKLAAVTALVFIIAFGAYYAVTRPVPLETGHGISTSTRSKAVSMGRGILLRVGPDSVIRRVDARSIRLDRGWVNVSVRNSRGIRVITRRMEVVDQGTDFDVVRGFEQDYVKVDDGSVFVTCHASKYQVNAGQLLVAEDDGEPSLGTLPEESVQSGDVEKPLKNRDYTFVPRASEDILWEEGLHALASEFPNARLLSRAITGTVSIKSETQGLKGEFSLAADSRIWHDVYVHSGEIVKAAAGGRIDSHGWAIPIGVIMVNGEIAGQSGASGGVFFVQLVSKDGTVVWRLNDVSGYDFDMPVVMKKPRPESLLFRNTWSRPLGYDHLEGVKANTHTARIWLDDWPGELKPMLELTMHVTEPLQDDADMEEMRNKLDSSLGGSKEFSPDNFMLVYMDPDCHYRLLMVWNRESRAQLCRITDLNKQGRSGSAILGAIVTDVPLDEPAAGSGAYFIKLVQSSSAGSPHLEIAAPNAHGTILPKLAAGNGRGPEGQMSWATKPGTGENTVRPDCAEVFPEFEFKGNDETGFPIRFSVIGRPDGSIRYDKDGGIRIPMNDIWAQGWIRIRRP